MSETLSKSLPTTCHSPLVYSQAPGTSRRDLTIQRRRICASVCLPFCPKSSTPSSLQTFLMPTNTTAAPVLTQTAIPDPLPLPSLRPSRSQTLPFPARQSPHKHHHTRLAIKIPMKSPQSSRFYVYWLLKSYHPHYLYSPALRHKYASPY